MPNDVSDVTQCEDINSRDQSSTNRNHDFPLMSCQIASYFLASDCKSPTELAKPILSSRRLPLVLGFSIQRPLLSLYPVGAREDLGIVSQVALNNHFGIDRKVFSSIVEIPQQAIEPMLPSALADCGEIQRREKSL